MRHNRIQRVVVHAPNSMLAITSSVNAFCVEAIERRLKQSGLTTKEQLFVIDHIIETMKSREVEGIIE